MEWRAAGTNTKFPGSGEHSRKSANLSPQVEDEGRKARIAQRRNTIFVLRAHAEAFSIVTFSSGSWSALSRRTRIKIPKPAHTPMAIHS